MTVRAPHRPAGGRVRLPVTVVEVTAFSWVAHVAAGGGTPRAAHLVAVAAAVAVLAAAVRRHLVRLPTAVAATVAAQVVLHLLLDAGAATHAHGTASLTGVGPGVAMVLAHAAAAVVTALALTWQEQVLVRLVDRLVPALHAVPPPAPGGPARTLPLLPPTLRLLVDTAPGRGPPRVARA